VRRDPTIVYTPAAPRSGGWVELNPLFAPGLAALGIDTPAVFLELPGEVVSGHPDRHVRRVALPGFATAFYLKRQHAVAWRERLRNWRAGFGAVSRSEREADVLMQLSAAGLPCPRWVAVGADARGRAFLMVEELPNARDLRRVLSDAALPQPERTRLADRIGRLVALLHATGFTTPDLTAKHLFVFGDSDEITPIDWQGTRRVGSVEVADRVRSLAALHASVADELATPRERLRVLRAALRPARSSGLLPERFPDLARRVAEEAARIAGRRSLRDQRLALQNDQRLVWLAGEAVCAVPGVAANWPSPAIAPPFYDSEPGTFSIRLPDGREAQLVRGRSFAPLGRLRAWACGKPWRSPGASLGRILFHLERYGVPAPRLLAFGQRFVGPASAEWFALHSPPAPLLAAISPAVAEQLGRCLRLLHDAGCRPEGNPQVVFGFDRSVCVRDVTAIRLVKRVTARDGSDDLRRLLATLDPDVRSAAEAGYRTRGRVDPRPAHRLFSASVSR
jgi:hypothetical protein